MLDLKNISVMVALNNLKHPEKVLDTVYRLKYTLQEQSRYFEDKEEWEQTKLFIRDWFRELFEEV